jgi:hypothetical protein
MIPCTDLDILLDTAVAQEVWWVDEEQTDFVKVCQFHSLY